MQELPAGIKECCITYAIQGKLNALGSLRDKPSWQRFRSSRKA
jgi:hypothetical protein